MSDLRLRIIGGILALIMAMAVAMLLKEINKKEIAEKPAPVQEEKAAARDTVAKPVRTDRKTIDDSPIDRINRQFIRYSKRFFGMGFDWRWFKAQGVCESNLDSAARSSCHAVGIMQILPSTFADVRMRYPEIGSDIRSVRWNIAAGIGYDRLIWDMPFTRSEPENRLRLTFAGYNGGMANVQKAVNRCGNNNWECVKKVAPEIGTWRSGETIRYVERIWEVRKEIGRR